MKTGYYIDDEFDSSDGAGTIARARQRYWDDPTRDVRVDFVDPTGTVWPVRGWVAQARDKAEGVG